MGVLENWYINLTNCLHGAARLFPDLLCSCAAWAFSKTLFLSAPQRPFCCTFPTFSKSLFDDMYCFGEETTVPLFTEINSIAEYLFGLLWLQTRNGATPGLLIHSTSPLSIASKTPETENQILSLSKDISQWSPILTIEIFRCDICIRIAL